MIIIIMIIIIIIIIVMLIISAWEDHLGIKMLLATIVKGDKIIFFGHITPDKACARLIPWKKKVFNTLPNHPWAILLFYDTHDISRNFNMMQHIAIFSRYFPDKNLVKKYAWFPPKFVLGAFMLRSLQQKCRILCFRDKNDLLGFFAQQSAQPKMQSMVLIHHK